jgi:hypothetical protein
MLLYSLLNVGDYRTVIYDDGLQRRGRAHSVRRLDDGCLPVNLNIGKRLGIVSSTT